MPASAAGGNANGANDPMNACDAAEDEFEDVAQQFFEILDTRFNKMDSELSQMKADFFGQFAARMSALEAREVHAVGLLDARLSALESQLTSDRTGDIKLEVVQSDDKFAPPQISQHQVDESKHREQEHSEAPRRQTSAEELAEDDSKHREQEHSEAPRTQTSAEELAEVAERFARQSSVHAMGETIYEAILLVFLPGLKLWDVIFTVFAYVFNMVLQALFLYVMYTTFLGSHLPSIEHINLWRSSEGHEMTTTGGPSLVARVCAHDRMLGTHAGMVFLFETLENYLTGGAGSMLSVAVLLVWAFSVTGEFRQCISFGRALWNLPVGGATAVSQSEGTLKLISISRACLVTMLLITSLRAILAVLLGYVGARWLVQEIDTTQLILNAGALAFVLSVDEIVYEEVSSRRVAALVKELAPLEKKRSKVHKIPIIEVVHKIVLCCSLCFVAVMSLVYLKTMRTQMQDIRAAMCQEPRDFKIARHKTGLYLVAPTQPFTESALLGVRAEGIVEAVTDDRDLAWVPEYSWLATENDLIEFSFLPVGDIFWRFTKDLPDACLDHDAAFNDQGDMNLQQFADALKHLLGNESLSSCQDAWPSCGAEQNYLVRALCPVTCGCATSRSGLFQRGPDSGCPYEVCAGKAEHQAAAGNLTCEDEATEDLVKLQEWSWLSGQVFARYGRWFFGSEELEAARESMIREGCEYLRAIPEDMARVWCRGETGGGTSIAAFCPEACHCASDFVWSCPPACGSR